MAERQHEIDRELFHAYRHAAAGNEAAAFEALGNCSRLVAVLDGPWSRINGRLVSQAQDDVRRILRNANRAAAIKHRGDRDAL